MSNVIEFLSVWLPWAFEKVAIPLAAAFAGAWFAFRYGQKREQKVERDRNILAAHQLLFCLLQQCQDLRNLQDFVGEREPDHLLLTALNKVQINKGELAFLVRSHPNALNDAILAEHGYLQAIDALSTFNDYTRPVQQFCRDHAVGIGADGKVIIDFDVEMFPAFEVDRTLKTQAYSELVKAIQTGCEKNKEATEVLQQLFMKMFPEERFCRKGGTY